MGGLISPLKYEDLFGIKPTANDFKMKLLVLILVMFISIYTSGQQLTTEIQAKRGVFTERLYLKDRWIDSISTNLNSADSASNNVLATGRAIMNFARLKAGDPIKNQFSVAQPASFWLQGTGTIGALPGYRNALSGGLSAQLNITQNEQQHGLSVQQANYNAGTPAIDLFKNASPSFNTLQALQPGDSIGSIIFSGVAGDNNTITNAMSLHGLVEKTAPAFLTSGFVFNTTDTNGAFARRMWLNGQGSLSLGNVTTNPYRLNVADGDVRINSLAGNGNVLLGSDDDGRLYPVQLGSNNLWMEDGMLGVNVPSYHLPYWKYVATLTQTGTNNPVAFELENSSGTIQWTRIATGVYTATSNGGFASGFTWMSSEASDSNGNAAFVKLYKSGLWTITMVVKDAARNNTDNWSGISVEIKEWIQF
jgi:hypothetical protein